jgi:peptide chain release factor subunit 1
LFATLSGTSKTVLAKLTVDLPNKHSRGGQSQLRYSRLREEARHNYIRKVAETAAGCFLKDDAVNVQGLILAGSADLKTDLQASDLFGKRLQEKVLQVVDCEYGGENGFNQAVEASVSVLAGVKMVQEKQILKKYFDEIVLDTGKIAYGIVDTIKALELGAVQSILLYENFNMDLIRTGIFFEGKKIYESSFLFSDNGDEKVQFSEWLAENLQKFGVQLTFVSDSSTEGNQFVKGIGGIGAFLRWKVNLEELDEFEDDDQVD